MKTDPILPIFFSTRNYEMLRKNEIATGGWGRPNLSGTSTPMFRLTVQESVIERITLSVAQCPKQDRELYRYRTGNSLAERSRIFLYLFTQQLLLLDTFKYVWFDSVKEFFFILSDLCQRDLVQEPIDRRGDDHNLSFDRDQGILQLFRYLGKPSTAMQQILSSGIRV